MNSNFDYCIAYDGAVIYINGTNARIDGSLFTHSSAINNGGAIYVAGSDATVSNSVLNFNNATNYGGAIYVDGANARLDGDVFANCSSDRLNGGAVYVQAGLMLLILLAVDPYILQVVMLKYSTHHLTSVLHMMVQCFILKEMMR